MTADRKRSFTARTEMEQHSSQTALRYLLAGLLALALAMAVQIKPANASGKVVGAVIAGAVIGGVIAHHVHKNRYYRPYTVRKYPVYYRKRPVYRHYRPAPYRTYARPVVVVPLPFIAW